MRGEISGNTSGLEGAGIYMHAYNEAVANAIHLNIRGDVKVQNNTAKGSPNNIYLNAFGVINFMTETFGGIVWLYPMSRNSFASFTKGFKKSKTAVSNHIKADGNIATATIDTAGLYGDAGEVYWKFGSGIHDQYFPGNHAQSTDFNKFAADNGWTTGGAGDVSLPAGTYHLTGNLSIPKTLKVSSGTVNFCLNNYTLTYTGNNSVVFGAKVNTSLNIFADGENGKIVGGNAGIIEAIGNFTLYGGTLTGGKNAANWSNTGYAGGVSVNGGTFTMMGGKITGCSDNGTLSLIHI